MNIKSILLATAVVATLSGASFAADLVPQTVLNTITADPVTGYNWTGLYIGADAGYAFNGDASYVHDNVNNFGGPGGTYDMGLSGGLVGVHAGGYYEFNPIVIGAEVGYDWSNITGDHNFTQYHNDTTTSLGNILTAKAQLGFALDRALVYAEAGYAGGDVTAGQTYSPQSLVWNETEHHNGYVVGAGVKYAVTDNVIVGVKYDYYNLGNVTYSGNDSSGRLTTIDGNASASVIAATLDYKF